MFKRVVTSETELRELMGTPSERAIKKESATVDEPSREFIGHAPFLLLATSSEDGRCDVSPKGDAPGFVRVLDERHLVIPDRPGNKRLDGMRNILRNPHVGLIFLIPGREETLRVNGRAWIVRDEAILGSLKARDKQPLLAIGVEVEECFFHCPKAFRRSQLWEPAAWPDRSVLPSMACVLYEKLKPAGKTLDEYLRESEEGLQRTLY
ncbi:MAG: phosphohydrolase [Candidatus Rokuibacteriota bacterium]|nr:MAG: phosphohydrolase [Candidatus Rokubacteria bacterium]